MQSWQSGLRRDQVKKILGTRAREEPRRRSAYVDIMSDQETSARETTWTSEAAEKWLSRVDEL